MSMDSGRVLIREMDRRRLLDEAARLNGGPAFLAEAEDKCDQEIRRVLVRSVAGPMTDQQADEVIAVERDESAGLVIA